MEASLRLKVLSIFTPIFSPASPALGRPVFYVSSPLSSSSQRHDRETSSLFFSFLMHLLRKKIHHCLNATMLF